ncbi:vWA domain-containing protein [Oceanobacter mangrovi]|uniref:vWA domain-containing protein n=1 Tax=Oceanobacter mangrovi TaxID=2862510 RepID=UPI001C8D66BB|nr:vWA domain-containing protein [Oceanobacter mangrovi]
MLKNTQGLGTRGLMSLLLVLSLLLPFTARAADDRPVDVRLIIDISGSMKETDPGNLRVPALNLVVELLPQGSQAGVWTFGKYVNMLVPLSEVNGAWRAKAREAGLQINSAGQRTNLTDALDKARWKISADSGYRQSVILLTDGKIDVAPGGPQTAANQASRKRLLEEVLPAYQAAGAKIHTLALSDAADLELLQQIALETNGLYLKADNAEELGRAFLQAFDRSAPADQVPLSDNRFNIDASVREFTVLVFRKPGARQTRLVSPSGKGYQFELADRTMRWHRDFNFDLITISRPEAGEWQLDADIDPENRVRILSDLKLQVDGIAATLFSGDPLDLALALTNEGKVVKEPHILGLTDFTLTVTTPDGKTASKLISDPEKLPADGLFRETFERFTQPGQYRFEVLAQGRTFSRQQSLTSNLAEPFNISSEERIDDQKVVVHVVPQSDMIDSAMSRVLVRTVFPDGSSKIVPMDPDPQDNSWRFEATASQGDGRYVLEVNIRGVTTSGKTFRSHPQEINIDFPLTDDTMGLDLASKAAAAASPTVPNIAVAAAVNPPEPESAAAQPEPPAAPAKPVEPASEAAAKPEPAKQEPSKPVVAADDQESGVLLWILVGSGVVLVIAAGAGFWFLRKRKASGAAGGTGAATAAGVAADQLDEKTLAQNIQNMDDFEAFMSEGEEQVLDSADVETAADEPEGPDTVASDRNVDPMASDGADTDLSNVDDDDDWGEFDLDGDDETKK